MFDRSKRSQHCGKRSRFIETRGRDVLSVVVEECQCYPTSADSLQPFNMPQIQVHAKTLEHNSPQLTSEMPLNLLPSQKLTTGTPTINF